MIKWCFKFVFKLVVLVVILIAVARMFFFYIYRTDSNAMAPTLIAGDEFAVLTRWWTPSRGDIVVCERPDIPGQWVALRLVGLPGDTIEIKNNTLFVNNIPVEQDIIGDFELKDFDPKHELYHTYSLKRTREILGDKEYETLLTFNSKQANFKPTKVKEGFFLLADNRNLPQSKDSRFFGLVNPSKCRGKALFLLWPAKGIKNMDPTERRFTFLK
jgi:signal peptidase I